MTASIGNVISCSTSSAARPGASVLIVTWIFLGSRIAILTSIGIPFTLSGTFLILSAMGETLNNTVLLGVVIALGMLVDNAVVVTESIHRYQLKNADQREATRLGVKEVAMAVTASVHGLRATAAGQSHA